MPLIITRMQALRNARSLTRWMLVWFALWLGAAVASPLMSAHSYELICSGAGMVKLLVKGQDGSTSESAASSMDCPLCAPGGAPPVSPSVLRVVPAQPLAYATWPVPAARIAALTAAPLPARGPPSVS